MEEIKKRALIKEIAEKNERLKALTEEVKKLKEQAQMEFPLGMTIIDDAVVTIKECSRTNFDSATFKLDFPKQYNKYSSITVYKTVVCSVQE
jgi:hypothetical protein